MKKLISTLLLVLMAVATANAQLLYRISGKDLKKPSYIVGTLHLANPSFVDKIPGARHALDETSQVYGELDMSVMANPDSMRLMQQRMMLPEGKTLKTVLSAEQYKRLDEALTSLMGVGLSNPVVEQQMGKLSPASINTQLTLLMYMKNHMGEFDPTNTIDMYFQTQARNNNEKVGGLETLAMQTEVLLGTPLDRQTVQLDCLLKHLDHYSQMTERLAKAYFAQDINALHEVMNETFDTACDATPEEIAQLIDNRNRNWVKEMPSIMSSAPTLFVVGAGHLPGDNGVLSLLKKQGYKVEAVK